MDLQLKLIIVAIGILLILILIALPEPKPAGAGGTPKPNGAPKNKPLPVGTTGIMVIDGDTIRTPRATYRIMGIDAPETYQARTDREYQLGMAAKAKLHEIMSSGSVKIVPAAGDDKYGRGLAYVLVNDVDVAKPMIASGLARPYDGGRRQPW